MPITIRMNEAMCLRTVAFHDAVTAGDVAKLISLYEANPTWLSHDSMYLLGANRIDATSADLDDARRRIFAVYKKLDLQVQRRSAWIFQSERMRWFAEHWLRGRHSHDGGSAEFCMGPALEDARALFSEEELASVRTGDGFQTLVCIDTPR